MQLLCIESMNSVLLVLIEHKFDLIGVQSEPQPSLTKRRQTNLTHALCKLRAQLAICDSITHFTGSYLRSAVDSLRRRQTKDLMGDGGIDGMVN